MHWLRAAGWALLISCCLSWLGPWASTASAQSADELLEQGIAQRRAGDDLGALASFQRAYDASPTPRAAAQLGLVHQALGQWVEAHARLREALGATTDAWIVRNHDALAQAFSVVEGEVGTVEILVSGDVPAGTHATIGAREIPTFPMAQPIVVVAGEEEIEVTAPDHRAVRRSVRVRAGQLSRVTVELRPETTEVGGAEVGQGSTASTSGTTDGGTTAGDTGGDTAGGATSGTTDGGGGDDWLVWVIVGAVVVVGAGVAIGVVASQQSLEAPRPGSIGAVELLRF